VALQEQPGAEHRVVAGLLRRRGRALLVHRSPRRTWYPDAWDLPGGHVQGEETPTQALRRELSEELGILAEVAGEPFAHLQGTDFRMEIWALDRWQGEPTNRDGQEHDALAWLSHAELTDLRLADPRLPGIGRRRTDRVLRCRLPGPLRLGHRRPRPLRARRARAASWRGWRTGVKVLRRCEPVDHAPRRMPSGKPADQHGCAARDSNPEPAD
jgi:8-oxo-dGTP diphosphatase